MPPPTTTHSGLKVKTNLKAGVASCPGTIAAVVGRPITIANGQIFGN